MTANLEHSFSSNFARLATNSGEIAAQSATGTSGFFLTASNMMRTPSPSGWVSSHKAARRDRPGGRVAAAIAKAAVEGVDNALTDAVTLAGGARSTDHKNAR
ncbi:MAG: hypothetical protein CL678_01115 [Bdellovibrionaceae bacterium]|nr:hypothetical protein [Pseudobdellovibrionaceae bacterium]